MLDLDQEARADVNADQAVNASDALLMLQYSVTLIISFPIEKEAVVLQVNPYTNSMTYAQSAPSVVVEGPVTTFQTGISYMPSVHIPSDAVMPYVENVGGYAERVSSWAEGFEGKALFIMMNSQLYPQEYFTDYGGSEDEIQIDRDGNVLRFADWESAMWLVPTRQLSEYCFQVIESYCDEYPVEAVIMEEPDFMRAAGYSQAFRNAWKEYYGEEWVDPASSPDALYRASRLKVHMFEEHFEWIGREVQDKYGDRVRLIVATHSVPAYNVFPIVAGDAHYAALEHVDGIIGQTWSNTMKVPVAYGGGAQQRLFESGYLGYASFPDLMRSDQWLFTLTDPYEDFGGDDWDFYRDCYAKQVVAQLMQQDIHRFQETIWVSRSFSADVPIDYRAMQLGVFQAMNEAPGQASTLYAGTPGISMALSDSLSWQYGAQYQPTESTANGFYGVTVPLIERGIPLSITSLDQLSSVDDLRDVRLLLLSYDSMKPVREEINEILAQWVKEGACCSP